MLKDISMWIYTSLVLPRVSEFTPSETLLIFSSLESTLFKYSSVLEPKLTLLTNLYVFVSESRTYKIPLIYITYYKYYLIENGIQHYFHFTMLRHNHCLK